MLQRMLVLLISTGAVLAASVAVAQEYPDRPIHLIVPFPPGATDLAARTVAKPMSTVLGKPIVVENKPGGEGAIGAGFLSRSAPDGYTLMYSSGSNHVLRPHLYENLGYDPFGFTPIGRTVGTVNVLAVGAVLPARTVSELLSYGKANKDKASYGSSGGSAYLAGELLKFVSGVDFTAVPYKGAAPALIDLIGGRIAFMFAGTGQVLTQAAAGKVRVLAVVDDTRYPKFPDVPTMAQAGLKDFDLPNIWHGLFGPLKMQPAVVSKLNRTLQGVLADPEVIKAINDAGYDPKPSSADELQAQMRREFDVWARIVKAAKMEKQ